MVRFANLIVILSMASPFEARRLKAPKTPKTPKTAKGGSYKASKKSKYPVSVGSRPYFILDSMEESELKAKLQDCAENTNIDEKSDWSIGHRGACMQVGE